MPAALLWVVRNWKPVLLVALVGAAVLSWYLYQDARDDKVAAEVKLEQAEANSRALSEQVDRIRANAATAAVIAEILNRGVNDALTENPDWSSQRTPDAVVDRLCQHLRCAAPRE